MNTLLSILSILVLFSSCAIPDRVIHMVNHGITNMVIVVQDDASESELFAANELAKYLNKVSTATFPILLTCKHDDQPAIILNIDKGLGFDHYTITSDKRNILLAGSSERALLFSVYDFLERLGCLWLSPDFSYYDGNAEYIPGNKNLDFPVNINIIEKPVFKFRKLDIAEGRSLDHASLEKIIDWMPKARLNTIMIPIDMNLRGRTAWANYRDCLHELEKREIIIEVGQHGYQNFLNARMKNGLIFDQYPEWFGKNSDCTPSTSDEVIFNLDHDGAVDFFIENVIKYLKKYPEIDILDLWPPDYAKWNECQTINTDPPNIRHSRFIEKVGKALLEACPDVRLQMIAFAQILEPTAINSNIIVDICPIDQNFEKQIFDITSSQNKIYADVILNWRKMFEGDLGIYTYYRKYAWRSLPNIIPNYMQMDLQWYASIPIQGISCYAEPGDWGTYELNHYVLNKLEWNPFLNLDSLIEAFCKGRYQENWKLAKDVFHTLERTIRIYGNIRHSQLKSPIEILEVINIIKNKRTQIHEAQKQSSDTEKKNFTRLDLMLGYALLDLDIQLSRSSNASENLILEKISIIMDFQKLHANKGILIYNPHLNANQLLLSYNRQ